MENALRFDDGKWKIPYLDSRGGAISFYLGRSGFEIEEGTTTADGLVTVKPPEGWRPERIENNSPAPHILPSVLSGPVGKWNEIARIYDHRDRLRLECRYVHYGERNWSFTTLHGI